MRDVGIKKDKKVLLAVKTYKESVRKTSLDKTFNYTYQCNAVNYNTKYVCYEIFNVKDLFALF